MTVGKKKVLIKNKSLGFLFYISVFTSSLTGIYLDANHNACSMSGQTMLVVMASADFLYHLLLTQHPSLFISSRFPPCLLLILFL